MKLAAVLRGALDGRDKRHHSAASMTAAIKAALRDHTRWQAVRRLWWLVPASGAAMLPVWFALQAQPEVCADAATSAVAGVEPGDMFAGLVGVSRRGAIALPGARRARVQDDRRRRPRRR